MMLPFFLTQTFQRAQKLAFLFIFSGISCALSAEPDFPPSRDAVECTPRAGLPNFLDKIAKGGEIHVAYLGGSITAQPGYRVKSLAYFNKIYPNCKFTEIYAAIGGTGSDLGVLRIDHDVFPGKPDLMFVEFAVNDAGGAPREIVRAMEGIVRKTWRQFPTCDIIFVYTFTATLLPELKTGKLNRSAATMEVVADTYGIPTIHMGLEAVRLEGEGKLLMKAPEAKMERVSGDELNQSATVPVGPDGKIPFSKDGTHPYPNTGHQLYEEAIERSIPGIVKASLKIEAHTLTAPLDADNYESTVMLDIEMAKQNGGWTKLPMDGGLGKPFSSRMNSLWKADPGAELTFTFKGKGAKIYDLLGPDCGKVEIKIDNTVTTANRIDGYCTYHRLSLLEVAGGLPDKVHQVVIRVLSDPLDKSKILFSHNRADIEKNPEKYEGSFWYAGAIFLTGALVR